MPQLTQNFLVPLLIGNAICYVLGRELKISVIQLLSAEALPDLSLPQLGVQQVCVLGLQFRKMIFFLFLFFFLNTAKIMDLPSQ